MARILYAIRHAAPPQDKQGRYWGKADPGTDGISIDQTVSIPEQMETRPARILTSPLRRAVLTAERIGGALRIAPEPMPWLAEVDFGLFDGLTFSEAESLYPEAANAWAQQGDAFAFPCGESIPDFLARAKRAYTFCIGLPEEAILCVTHGGVISAWHSFHHNIPLEQRFSFLPSYAALTTFTVGIHGIPGESHAHPSSRA